MPLEMLQIEVVHTGEKIKARFNPDEYTVAKDNSFATQQIPGLSGPLVQFVSGGQRTLDLKLFFDTWDTPTLPKVDVRKQTDRVVRLLDIDEKLHAPPILRVSWSSLQLQCVLTTVSQSFTMFTDAGTPVRATLTVKFNEVIFPEQESQQIKRQTADFTKLHRVIEGETLSSIAAAFYDNPQQWRPIAMANGITDPRSIVFGQQLRVPMLPFLDPSSGEVVP